MLTRTNRQPPMATISTGKIAAVVCGIALALIPGLVGLPIAVTSADGGCAPAYELAELEVYLERAVEILSGAASDADARHQLATHTLVPEAELLSTERTLEQVAWEAMAAYLTGRPLAEIIAEVDAGKSVWLVIEESGVDAETAYYRSVLLISALNLHAYLAPAGLPDVDGDGIANMRDVDIDGDGVDNSMDPDVDGDGTPNELDPDVDGDGLDNLLDDDVDGDFLINADDEDVDGDGLANAIDGDVDGDGFANEDDWYNVQWGLPPWINHYFGSGCPGDDDDDDSAAGDDDDDSAAGDDDDDDSAAGDDDDDNFAGDDDDDSAAGDDDDSAAGDDDDSAAGDDDSDSGL